MSLEAPVGAQRQGSALIRAAENGHAETARLLLDKGAAVDARNKVVAVSASVLHYALMPPSESTPLH